MVAGRIGLVAGDSATVPMYALVVVFVIVGDFIWPVPAIISFMPVVNALTEQAPINAVHIGVVLIVTLSFDLITPPWGLALLMASKFLNIKFSPALKASLSIYVIFFAAITFTILPPEVILWLPRHVFPESVGCFESPSGAGDICP